MTLIKETIDIRVQGVGARLATMRCEGEGAPIVFLHGFGSTKEDYADVVRHRDFAGRPVIAYDAPGCGATFCDDLNRISIPFLVEAACTLLAHLSIDEFHLVGHSVGGLTALLLAEKERSRVKSFVNIEGNLAPEDCFLSRQIVDYPAENPEAFLEAFIERTWRSPTYSSALYAASLRHKVRAGAIRSIFSSMVELSDHGNLLNRFLSLPCPRMFMYGEQNKTLSYLPALGIAGITLAQIPNTGHFPMYSNPLEMWARIAAFLNCRR